MAKRAPGLEYTVAEIHGTCDIDFGLMDIEYIGMAQLYT